MTWGTFNESENKAIPTGMQFDQTKEIRTGDILLSRSNTAELVGATVLVGHCRSHLLLSDKSMRLLYPTALSARWLQRALAAPQVRSQISKMANGTSDSMRNVSQQNVFAIKLSIPPRNEQERIADALDELISDLDAGLEALKSAQAKLALYRAAVLKAAVQGDLTAEWRRSHTNVETAPVLLQRILKERRQRWEEEQLRKFKANDKTPPANWKSKYNEPVAPDIANLPVLPKDWCWASIDQLCYEVRNGYSAMPNASVGVRIFRISAVRALSLDLNDVRFLSGKEEDYKEYLVASGDLLFTRYNGTKSLVAVCALVPETVSATAYPDKLIRARVASSNINPRFLALAANVGSSRRFLESRIRTTAGQAGVSGTDIKQTPIPLPPQSEQDLVVDICEGQLSVVEHLGQDLKAKDLGAVAMRQTILHHAFLGKLVCQDPNDEPAAKLLERIAEEREVRERLRGKKTAKRKV